MTFDFDTREPGSVRADTGVGLSRRSVVRVSLGAAWAAPVVTLVTAAPALATSVPPPPLQLVAFAAHYDNFDSDTTANPNLLKIHGEFCNNTVDSMASCTVVLTIDTSISDMQPAIDAPGWTTQVPPAPSGPWTLQFFGPPIAAGGTVVLDATVTLGYVDTAPFLGCRGADFELPVFVSAGGESLDFHSDVHETPFAWPSPGLGGGLDLFPGPGANPVLELTAHDIGVDAASRSGIGHMHLVVALPRPAGTCLAAPPTLDLDFLDPRWQVDAEASEEFISPGVADGGNSWLLLFRTISEGYGWGQLPAADRGPESFTVRVQLGSDVVPEDFSFTTKMEFSAEHLVDQVEVWCDYPQTQEG